MEDGISVGMLLGGLVGATLGIMDGTKLGLVDGVKVGVMEGGMVGLSDGAGLGHLPQKPSSRSRSVCTFSIRTHCSESTPPN